MKQKPVIYLKGKNDTPINRDLKLPDNFYDQFTNTESRLSKIKELIYENVKHVFKIDELTEEDKQDILSNFNLSEQKQTSISESILFREIKKLIKTDRSRVEKMLGIRIDVVDAGRDHTLLEIGDCYFNKNNFADETKLNANQRMKLAEIKKT